MFLYFQVYSCLLNLKTARLQQTRALTRIIMSKAPFLPTATNWDGAPQTRSTQFSFFGGAEGTVFGAPAPVGGGGFGFPNPAAAPAPTVFGSAIQSLEQSAANAKLAQSVAAAAASPHSPNLDCSNLLKPESVIALLTAVISAGLHIL